MCKSKHTQETPVFFDLEEFLHSETALSKKIENLPSWEIIEHLKELGLFLDGIRESWGSGIMVSSGFRSLKLNKEVGGVKTSVHKIGYAADITPANGKLDEFAEFLKDYLKDKDYDQCIFEQSGKTRWLHISLFNNKGEQRHMMFDLQV